MAFNMAKARALNKTAQGISERIRYAQNKLRAEYAGQMPAEIKGKWFGTTYETPPPDAISLPRDFVEGLIANMTEWRTNLLKHTEPFAR